MDDLAGWAALLGVPVAIVTALLPLRDRAALARLERIDALLRGTDLDEDHAQLLRAARNHLVRRVVAHEVVPGLGPVTWGLMILTFIFAAAVGYGAVKSFLGDEYLDALFRAISFLLLFGTLLYLATARLRMQSEHADNLIPTTREASRVTERAGDAHAEGSGASH